MHQRLSGAATAAAAGPPVCPGRRQGWAGWRLQVGGPSPPLAPPLQQLRLRALFVCAFRRLCVPYASGGERGVRGWGMAVRRLRS